MNNIKVIDDFLPQEDADRIEQIFTGHEIPYYFYPSISYGDNSDCFQFVHSLYMPNQGAVSKYVEVINPILQRLGAEITIRIKANLNPRTHDHMQIGEFHCDFAYLGITTAIYYPNTNNGYTMFETGKKVQSVKNRLVKFPVNIEHVGFSCTDQQVRSVINFNYMKSGVYGTV